jgi:inner membrane protein
MEAVAGFLDGLTVWHWIGLAIILLSIEVAVGTFDLLWVAIAAFATALFAVVAPAGLDGWGAQATMFGIASAALVALGRTVFRGLRRAPASHPNLNDRMSAMVGQRGEAAKTFEHGRGRVKVGDTVWGAVQVGEGRIWTGEEVVVEGAQGSLLHVRKV